MQLRPTCCYGCHSLIAVVWNHSSKRAKRPDSQEDNNFYSKMVEERRIEHTAGHRIMSHSVVRRRSIGIRRTIHSQWCPMVALLVCSSQFLILFSTTNAFATLLNFAVPPKARSTRILSTCCLAKRNSGAVPPPNEFSRTLRPERILRSGSQRSSGYQVSFQAEPNECQALASRFDLSEIASLATDLTLRPGDSGNRYYSAATSSSASSASVQVEGTCRATVTQRCVRTNEDFQIDLEFPLYCVVRPVVPLSETLGTGGLNNNNSNGRTEPRSGKSNGYLANNYLDEMDVLELQRMLQAGLSAEDDVLIEDEAIYTVGGLLDLGELVAQLFWLELDPYPKKPGTGPIQRSITG